jgi:hypothetical protein
MSVFKLNYQHSPDGQFLQKNFGDQSQGDLLQEDLSQENLAQENPESDQAADYPATDDQAQAQAQDDQILDQKRAVLALEDVQLSKRALACPIIGAGTAKNSVVNSIAKGTI